MHRINFILTIFFFVNINSIGQVLQYSHSEVTYFSAGWNSQNYATRIDSFSQIPEELRIMVMKHLVSKTQGHHKNFRFLHTDIYNLEKYLRENSEDLFIHNINIPKYAFAFIWQDPTLGIKKHYIILALDQYGQVINFTFPNLQYYEPISLTSLDKAKVIADSILNRDYLNFDLNNYCLQFDKTDSSLDWHLTYKMSSINNKIQMITVQISLVDEMCIKIYKSLGYELELEDIEIEKENIQRK